MASLAETERTRCGIVINAEGEFQAAKKLVDAAYLIEPAPAALQLRFLQTMTEVASEHTSLVMCLFPFQ